MRIEGIKEFFSIRPFEAIELPDLTVLVGLNGSGKTHLLRAIEAKAVLTDVTPPETPQPQAEQWVARIENSGSFPAALTMPARAGLAVPFPSSSTSGGGPPHRGPDPQKIAIANFGRYRHLSLDPLATRLETLVPRLSEVIQADDFWALGPDHLCKRVTQFGLPIEPSEVAAIFEEARAILTGKKLGQRSVPLQGAGPEVGITRNAIMDVVAATGKDPLEVTIEDLAGRSTWGSFGIFDPQINAMFSAYRDQRARNDIDCGAARRGEVTEWLTDDAFEAKFGKPPWTQLGELLSAFGLPYKIKEPSHKLEEPINLTLLRVRDKIEVDLANLSSGERILIRFILACLHFDPLRVKLSIPKLLLLDEMDASLHPEMTHRWLTAIRSELVGRRGIKCILTTHSPTTVAMAPEGALFEMVEGGSGPSKVTRQQALNRLTFGLPALAVDYDGRRQVFVESGTDAAAYEKLAAILKGHINLPRTLTFIATGPRRGKDEHNTGCSVVEHLVGQLTAHGNKSIFGILDWDHKNNSSDRIKVLAEGTHYALDNVMLNPLLVGALLIRHGVRIPGTSVTINDLPCLGPLKAQELAAAIQNPLKYPSGAPTGTAQVRLIGGIKVEITNAFTQSNGHEMERALVNAYPALNQFHVKTAGKLIEAVIDSVLTDWTYLTPEPITMIFRTIAEQETL